jgi:hypothetical protein
VTAVTYARLRVTDPARWRAAAVAWRQWAAAAGRWAADLGGHVARLREVWAGAAAGAAADRIVALRRGLDRFRLMCWEADQVLSEFAAALSRARALLARAVAGAAQAGLEIADDGTLRRAGNADATTSGPARGPGPGRAVHASAFAAFPPVAAASFASAAAGSPAWRRVAGELEVALRLAATADTAATDRLTALTAEASADPAAPPSPAPPLPPATATPAEVRRWWDGLTPAQHRLLVRTEPAWLGARDGVPAAFRDLANRLLLDERRAELDRALARAGGGDRDRLRDLRDGLAELELRLAQPDGPRAYLLRLGLEDEGRAVVALGDPDRAQHVLTQVPGMTADLASYREELVRAERVAVRAAELGPSASTSAVLWLGYDAPDFVDEAAGRGPADAGAAGLRRFQEGLRASHEGTDAHLTVLGHSYGSLVVGSAAADPGLQADDVVFVGSPGVGVDSVRDLSVPPERVWASTSRTDVIQWAPVSPRSLAEDLTASRAVPVAGALVAFGRPEDDLWHGRNPADPSFGARVFRSQAGAGHLGYWEPGGPALDALAGITLGRGAS